MSDEVTPTELQAQALLRAAVGVYQTLKVQIFEITTHQDNMRVGASTTRQNDILALDKMFAYAVDDLLQARDLDAGASVTVGNHALDGDEITARILLLDAILHLEVHYFAPKYSGKEYAGLAFRDGVGESPERLAHGLSAIQKYLTYKPRDVEGLLFCAKTLVRSDRDAEAIAVLDRAREVDPGNFEARKLLEILRGNAHLDPFHVDHFTKYNPGHHRELCLRQDADNTWYDPYPRGRLP